MLGTILAILLSITLVGVLPLWPYSRQWAYYPSGIIGALLVIVLALMVLGYI